MPLVNLQAYRREMRHYATEEVPNVVRGVRNELGEFIARGLVLATPGTPVDTGEARGGWFVTAQRGQRQSRRNNLDPIGTRTVQEMVRTLKAIKTPWLIATFRNTIEHISYLDEGRSDQAPAGMTGPTINAANAVFPTIRRRVEREARRRRPR